MTTYNENGQRDYWQSGGSSHRAAQYEKGIAIEFQPATFEINLQRLIFPAFVTGLSDSFSSDWTSTAVFGRNDPIYSFKSTTRSISLSFQVVSSNLREGVYMLRQVGLLTQYLYPGYKHLGDGGRMAAGANALNIVRPPLIYMKFTNLVDDHSPPGNSGFKSGRGGEWSGNGLLGVIKSLVITPNFDSGVFDGPGKREMYPKLIDISVEFGVLHQSPLGWDLDELAGKPNGGGLTGFMGNKSYKDEGLRDEMAEHGDVSLEALGTFPYGAHKGDFENEWEFGTHYGGSKSQLATAAMHAAYAEQFARGEFDTAAEVDDEELAAELEDVDSFEFK